MITELAENRIFSKATTVAFIDAKQHVWTTTYKTVVTRPKRSTSVYPRDLRAIVSFFHFILSSCSYRLFSRDTYCEVLLTLSTSIFREPPRLFSNSSSIIVSSKQFRLEIYSLRFCNRLHRWYILYSILASQLVMTK